MLFMGVCVCVSIAWVAASNAYSVASTRLGLEYGSRVLWVTEHSSGCSNVATP